MTRVDFYVLQDVALPALYRFTCRLAAKAVFGGHPVVVHTEDEASARELDALLWHNPQDRFLPHAIEPDAGSEPGAPVPLWLTWRDPGRYDGVLVNLAHDVPDFFGRFDRVAEVVVGETRAAGRVRYKFYRDRGFPLYHHELDDWEAQASS